MPYNKNPKDDEGMLLKMQKDCADSVKLIDEALSIQHTSEMQTLRNQWGYAQESVESLLQDFYADPTRDISSITHIVLWFMISHSVGLDELKKGIRQVKMPPNTNRIRRSQRRG